MTGGPIRLSRRRIYAPYPSVERPQMSSPPAMAVVNTPMPYPPPAGGYRRQPRYPPPAGGHRPQATIPDEYIADEEMNWVYDYTFVQLQLDRLRIGEGNRTVVPNRPPVPSHPLVPTRHQVPNSIPSQEVPNWDDGYEADIDEDLVPTPPRVPNHISSQEVPYWAYGHETDPAEEYVTYNESN